MRYVVPLSLALCLLGCSPASQDDTVPSTDDIAAKAPAGLETQILSAKDAKTSAEQWGRFTEYFAGETEGVTDLLSGVAEIKPGMEIHPPHKHAEEEFLMVLEGEGTWTLGDKEFPAEQGDMLYARAWDVHNISNTGDTVLKFVFWKWHSKGTKRPVDPAQ